MAPHNFADSRERKAVCERWIGSARRGALDWLLIAGERHLWRVLAKYIEHSNLARAHRSLGLRAPLAGEEAGQPIGEVVCRSRLGGLLNELLAAGGMILARDFTVPDTVLGGRLARPPPFGGNAGKGNGASIGSRLLFQGQRASAAAPRPELSQLYAAAGAVRRRSAPHGHRVRA